MNNDKRAIDNIEEWVLTHNATMDPARRFLRLEQITKNETHYANVNGFMIPNKQQIMIASGGTATLWNICPDGILLPVFSNAKCEGTACQL